MGRLTRLLDFKRAVRIRDWLNRQTRGRVGLYSTAEHYSTGPSAKVLRYFQYDDDAPLDCFICDWSGSGRRGAVHYFDELLDVRCPDCGTMLLVVSYPTLTEVREEAKRGNPEAIAELGRFG